MSDVLCIGVCTIDLIVRIPAFPEPDTRSAMHDLTESIGGVACVAAVALARLGARSAFAGEVGDDAYGRAIRTGLSADGVDVALLATRPQRATPTTVILSDLSAKTRTIINHPSAATASVAPSQALTRAALSAPYIHLDHTAFVQVAGDLLPRCRTAGTLVSLDAGIAIPGTEAYLPYIDVYVTTQRQLLDMTGEHEPARALAWVRERGPRIVAATQGAEGSVGLSDDGAAIHAPPFRVDVADTTGAGDVYHGAFLYALLQRQTLREALIFANAAAALSCRAVGGRPGCPTLAEVQALLQGGSPR